MGGTPAARNEEAGADVGAGTRRSERPSGRFREALRRKVPELDPAAEGGPTAGGGAAFLHAEPLRVAAPPAPTAARAASIERLLIGGAGGAVEARIRIGAGALAGAEISLTAAGPQAVTAQLLTPGAGSRQTLSVAMEEIRLRLRDKGILLAAPVARRRPGGDARDGGAETRGGSDGGWPAGR